MNKTICPMADVPTSMAHGNRGSKPAGGNRARLEAAIVAAMEVAANEEMRWGHDDCALWFANIIRDALGYDPAAFARGRYQTRIGALRILGRKGIKDAVVKAARRHGWKRIEPANGRPGDVGLVWTGIQDARGRPQAVLATAICRAPGWFVGRNERGYSAVAAAKVHAAWSVLDDYSPGHRVNLHSPIKIMPQPVHEPLSGALMLTALIESVVGGGTAIGGLASTIGGFIVSSPINKGISFEASNDRS